MGVLARVVLRIFHNVSLTVFLRLSLGFSIIVFQRIFLKVLFKVLHTSIFMA